ncbi:MAG: hypothetical protein K940chlam6_01497 [Chlamydiae bacterium]|nr:hypothetical protein [Chlamydiota bacterium]
MLIFIIIWAVAINWLAFQKGFYQLPKDLKKAELTVSHFQLLASFALYLILALLIAPLFAKFLLFSLHKINPELFGLPIALLTGIQCSAMIIVFCLLQSFLYRQDSILYRRIWKNTDHNPSHPIEFDLGLGALTWFLSFPIVTILSELIDKLLKSLGLSFFEQTAVKFVKAAMGSPISIVFALLSVLVLAPLIEEFLFRGLLQTYFKKRLGARAAILLSAFFFSLFHFSPSQGFGNVSLILSLFLLGGYLGFLYERQGSLWAPIGLHMTFNTVSALRIVFFPEAS